MSLQPYHRIVLVVGWVDIVIAVFGMHGLAVTLEIDFSLESLVAQPASKGFETRVLSHVRDQVGRLTEGLVTHHTSMGFFT